MANLEDVSKKVHEIGKSLSNNVDIIDSSHGKAHLNLNSKTENGYFDGANDLHLSPQKHHSLNDKTNAPSHLLVEDSHKRSSPVIDRSHSPPPHHTNDFLKEHSRSKSPTPPKQPLVEKFSKSKSPEPIPSEHGMGTEKRGRSKSPTPAKMSKEIFDHSDSPAKIRKSKSPEPESEKKTSPKKPITPKVSKKRAEVLSKSPPKTPDSKTPLFDMPLEATGKRERKNIERLAMPESTQKPLNIPEGKGIKLGNCPQVEASISKTRAEDLKGFHRFLFGKVGQAATLKKHLREFNGFDFDEESTEYKKKTDFLTKSTLLHVKDICGILNIKKTQPKEQLIQAIMEFCLAPKAETKIVPQTKEKKGRSSSSHKKSATRSKLAKTPKVKKTSGKSKATYKDSESTTLSEGEEENVVSEQDDHKGDSDYAERQVKSPVPAVKKRSRIATAKATKKKLDFSDSELESEFKPDQSSDEGDFGSAKKKTPAKSKPKKTPAKASAGSAKKAKPTSSKSTVAAKKSGVAAPKKSAQSPAKKGTKVENVGSEDNIYTESENEEATVEKKTHEGKEHEKVSARSHKIESDSSEDDEPLGKMEKASGYPNEDEIKHAISEILVGANLMETTMKAVCKKVYERFSSHDLTPKKQYIKDTVKSMLEINN